ncbi:MAG: N-acetylmuramoyl-L-alanine amidase [Alphaproteobacteria bacterium]
MQIIQHPSPNFGERPSGPINMVVLHYTGMENGAAATAHLCDPAAQVSAHYVVERDGRVLQLVAEDKRAWHAGVSFWAGETDINSCSIGIEIVNRGHDFLMADGSLQVFPDSQMQVVGQLLAGIMGRYGVPKSRVVAHSDIAPTRKQDPGEHFPWGRLAAQGLCLPVPQGCEDQTPADRAELIQGLAAFGYDVSDETAATRAFQRRFRPSCFSGCADQGTRKALTALTKPR